MNIGIGNIECKFNLNMRIGDKVKRKADSEKCLGNIIHQSGNSIHTIEKRISKG